MPHAQTGECCKFQPLGRLPPGMTRNDRVLRVDHDGGDCTEFAVALDDLIDLLGGMGAGVARVGAKLADRNELDLRTERVQSAGANDKRRFAHFVPRGWGLTKADA